MDVFNDLNVLRDLDEDGLQGWKCGENVGDLRLPLGRLSESPACQADLHVCRQCDNKLAADSASPSTPQKHR